jgi:hypothetical protein
VVEEILGIVKVVRTGFSFPSINEELFITTDRVIVARIGKGGELFGAIGSAVQWFRTRGKGEKLEKLPLDDILKADKNNFAIPRAEIRKVELKKFGRGAKVNIQASKKEYKWYAGGIPDKESAELEDYETVLKSAFPENLRVSK